MLDEPLQRLCALHQRFHQCEWGIGKRKLKLGARCVKSRGASSARNGFKNVIPAQVLRLRLLRATARGRA